MRDRQGVYDEEEHHEKLSFANRVAPLRMREQAGLGRTALHMEEGH